MCGISFESMIDTHAHLDFPEFDKDREKVISRFFEDGGKAVINVGVDLERSRKSLDIAEAHDGVFASVGLHPEYFSKTEKDLGFKIYDLGEIIEELRELAKHEKTVAIGEAGLDYSHAMKNTEHATQVFNKIKKKQKDGFVAQIEIAMESNLPVIVHCRDAWDDLFDILNHKSYFINQNFVLHCYSGDREDTEKFLKLPNVFFSFSGNITLVSPLALR